MRKVYSKFFNINKYNNFCSKFTRIYISMMLVIIGICAMCLSGNAFFSINITSKSNNVSTGIYLLDVTVDSNKIDENTIILDSGVHEITLSINNNSTTSTGFCVINDKTNSTTYYTEQIYKDTTDSNLNSITFKLDLQEQTTIEFSSHWGVPENYNYSNNLIENNETVMILTSNSNG